MKKFFYSKLVNFENLKRVCFGKYINIAESFLSISSTAYTYFRYEIFIREYYFCFLLVVRKYLKAKF